MVTITVIGSVNLDIVAQAPKLPAPGETITGAELFRFPGGKGANQAVAAARAGARVRLIGCVGDDDPGEAYVAHLVARGEVSDFDLSRRSQRTRPFLATILAMALAALELASPTMVRSVGSRPAAIAFPRPST